MTIYVNHCHTINEMNKSNIQLTEPNLAEKVREEGRFYSVN